MGARLTGVVLFAALLTLALAHLALAVGLVRRGAWGRGLLALALPPLAPWWGWQAGMRRRSAAWGVALAVYVLGVLFAAGPWSGR
ncbi:MAG TPA: hypothetical protein VKU41_29030 [Polyangiaceae bacterium]|nr:hypothetical protein [Polyangiaceae bacterium]